MKKKAKKTSVKVSSVVVIIIVIILYATGNEGLLDNGVQTQTEIAGSLFESIETDTLWVVPEQVIEGKKVIIVEGGNRSGDRESNVIVDVGYGEREYWAVTNDYGQLINLYAKQVILQDDDVEKVTESGRYYHDEANVPGTEEKDLDQGHVIADSLGGVANAYNITPQDSTLNRHGDQAYLEDSIRKFGGCTNMVVTITYPNTKTQVPSHYLFEYYLGERKIVDEFDNSTPTQ